MKATIAFFVVLFATMLLMAPGAHAESTVTVCHATGAGTSITLNIPYKAAFGRAGHFNENGTSAAGHEDDYLGPCIPSSTTTSTTTTSSTTSTTSTTTTSSVPTTSSSTTTPPSGSSSTTTSIVIDTCEDLGSCQTTTTDPTITTSTLAEGGASPLTATFGMLGALLTGLGAGVVRLARR